MPFQKRLLSLALATASFAGAAQASAEAMVEEVVVMGKPIKQSETAAILAKRDALNVTDSISADTIGRFPDQNLADSLARIPGVAIERDQGQARYVNLRGAPFRYTSIAFDGIDVPGAENGRIPRFDSFPAVITRKLTVNKAILASMPGEAVSGFVDIETHSPFDKEGLSFALDAGLGEQDLGGGEVTRRNLRAGYSGERFGILAFASENSRDQITDNREYDFGLENGVKVPNLVDFRSYKVDRSDEAYGLTLEYRGEEALKRAYVTTLYSEFVDREQRNQYVIESLAPRAGLTAENVPVQLRRLFEDGVYKNSTDTTTFGVDFVALDFDIDLAYNRTETAFFVSLPIVLQVAGFASLGASGPVPMLASYDLTDETDPKVFLSGDPDEAVFLANLGFPVFNPLDQEADKFKADLSRSLDDQTILSFGFQADLREARGGATSSGAVPFPTDIVTINDFDSGVPWDSNTTNTVGGTYYDNPALDAAWRASGAYPENVVAEENVVAIDEDIYAAYGMVTRTFPWGSAIAGLRVEQTDVKNFSASGGSYQADFTNWLPSAHLNVDLSESLKLRLSASSGLNRPTYNEWRGTAGVNPIDREVSGGNPTLKAEESFGFDSSLEYYLEDGGLLSASLFYRTVDNVIYADSSTIDPGIYEPAAAGEQWTYTGFLNGSNGVFRGLELSAVLFADRFVEGLGLSTNVTFADGEFEQVGGETVGLPGTSDLIWNAALFYERFGFSARLNYSYRDEWISPIEDPSEFWGEMERLDAQLSYTLPMDLFGAEASVYASFNNLTDETDVRFAGNGTINQSESYGMHYLTGFRLNF